MTKEQARAIGWTVDLLVAASLKLQAALRERDEVQNKLNDLLGNATAYPVPGHAFDEGEDGAARTWCRQCGRERAAHATPKGTE